MKERTLIIRDLPISQLKTNPNNARAHSKHQIRQIAASINEFGFTNPVLVDNKNMVIAGHGRVAAAQLLGRSHVPTLRLENLSPDQVRAYVLADNRLAEKAGWDKSVLEIELQHLLTIDDFDITITGFEVAEVDVLLAESNAQPGSEDLFELSEASQVISRPGDLWQLGRHRILCGSALRRESYFLLMEGQQANVIFTDPPYNVPIDGHASGKGRVRHPDFQMAS